MVKAYSIQVRSMLEYCSPVWSPITQLSDNGIEKVQRFFTKRIAGLWSVPYDAVWMHSSSIHLNIVENPMIQYNVIKFLTVNWILINQMFISSILNRICVVMPLSCTNSVISSTVLSITLLIVLLICRTITGKRGSCNNSIDILKPSRC